MNRRLNYSGLVIAGIGFFLTRFSVALAIYEDPFRFYLAGIVPLVLGLGLAAFGVALVVADIDSSFVDTTAVWCVTGTVTMLALVVLTLLATEPGDMFDFVALRSQVYLSNFLIGGSVGGTLTGLYAARNRRQRLELRHQANRLEILNRMLRHEVLNAVTVIKGYASEETIRGPDTWAVVGERSATIERSINDVKYLSQSADPSNRSTFSVEIGGQLATSLETIQGQYPNAEISVDPFFEDELVLAGDRLSQVFSELLERAILQSTAEEPEIEISFTKSSTTVSVAIRYVGAQLAMTEKRLLEHGEIDQYDNPRSGFSLNVVRLLLEDYGGLIDIDSTVEGSIITITLPRATNATPGIQPITWDFRGILPAVPQLIVSLGASLLAGIAYGVASETLGGSIAGIGVFYGTASPVVGWITHEFHSVVFGFVFLGLITQAPERFRQRLSGFLAIGIGWALTLWIVAASVIAPIWLRLLGIPAPIPNFSTVILVSHLAWGITLAPLTLWGLRYLAPRLDRFIE